MANEWISIDTGDAKRLAKDLRTFAQSGVKHAVRNTLNDLAFEARKQWLSEMKERFVLRNKWTEGSIRVEKAKGTLVDAMQSRVGSLADYMGLQEKGGTKSGGQRGVRIPTSVAAGQGVGARPRTKPVRGPNRMTAIQLAKAKRPRAASTSQLVAASIRQSIAAGKRFVFPLLDHHYNYGRDKMLARVAAPGSDSSRRGHPESDSDHDWEGDMGDEYRGAVLSRKFLPASARRCAPSPSLGEVAASCQRFAGPVSAET